MNILSPVTYSANTKKIDELNVSKIIHQYNEELGLSVKKYFTNLESIKIYQCKDTLYRFYHPANIVGDESFYNKLKIQLEENYKVPYYCKWKWDYEMASNEIKNEDYVLEVGCGIGNFLEAISCKFKIGLELNQDAVKVCSNKGLNVLHSTIEDFALNCEKRFDKICFFQVLEHVTEINSFIGSIIKLLKPNGKILIAVPYSSPYLFKNDKFNTLNLPPHHMGLWNEKSLTRMAKFFGLKVDKLIIEKLSKDGYDFKQFYTVNKDFYYPEYMPFKKFFDNFFHYILRKYYYKLKGKNIFIILSK